MENYQNSNGSSSPKNHTIKIIIIVVAIIFLGWFLLSVFIVKQMNPSKTGSVANKSFLNATDKSSSAAMQYGINKETESYYKEHGTYLGFKMNYKGNTDEYCSSDVTLVVSPDGSKYVAYRPLCSSEEKIFCYDSTSKKMVKLSKNSISEITTSYECK